MTAVQCEIKSFRGRFNSMKESTIQYLERFEVSVLALILLLTSIEAIDDHEAFLKDNFQSMYEFKNHWEVFGYLNFYWNYLACDLFYQLLEVLVLKDDRFSDLLKEMEKYIIDLEHFRKSTTLELFCQAERHRVTDPPPDFRKMVTKHDWPDTVTLEDVEIFRRSLQQTYNLKKCAVMVKSVKTGSFTVTWLVHVSVVEMLRKKRALAVFKEFSVTRLEIHTSTQICVYQTTPPRTVSSCVCDLYRVNVYHLLTAGGSYFYQSQLRLYSHYCTKKVSFLLGKTFNISLNSSANNQAKLQH